MPKMVNSPQNKEQLDLLIRAVKGEVDLAKDLLNSYQDDLVNLEADSSMPEQEKKLKRKFIETAINESKELLNLRQKQLQGINRSGKTGAEARREAWNDLTIESKGMNAIMAREARAWKQQKHNNETVQRKAQAVLTEPGVVTDADVEEKEEKNNHDAQGTFNLHIEEKNAQPIKDKYAWIDLLISSCEDGRNEDTFSQQGKSTQQAIIDESNNPHEITANSPDDELTEGPWLVPQYDKDGKVAFDENGYMILTPVSEDDFEIFINNGIEVTAAKEYDDITQKGTMEINAREIGEEALKQQKEEFGILGPSRSDVIIRSPEIQKQLHLNWFQKLKLWFMRLFNKNYQLLEVKNNNYIPNEIKNYKPKIEVESQENDKAELKEKRTINGFSIPKAKRIFKDNKNKILSLSALGLASLVLFAGINARMKYNKNMIEQKATQIQQIEDMEKNTEEEEKQVLEDAEKENDQNNEQDNDEKDGLVFHDANELTSGSKQKQYLAHAGLEYTENSVGQGRRGTLGQDTIIEIFNRAIIRENEDRTKEIVLSTDGKTWEDYAKENGMSIEDIKNLLKQENIYEAVCVKVAETNDSIFNTYGWVKSGDLEESSKKAENLKNSEIIFEDNTKLIQQLQQQEQANQNQVKQER